MVLEAVLVASLALLAVFVGAAIPALAQLRRTLRSAQDFFETSGRRADTLMRELEETTRRLNRVADTMDAGARTLVGAMGALRKIGRVVTAVGPAVMAAVGALAGVSARDGGPERPAEAGSPPASTETAAGKEVGAR